MLKVPLFVFLVALVQVALGDEFPSELSRCNYDDSECVLKIINGLFFKNFSGYPGLNLPSLDPLKIKKMQIKQGGESPINIVLDFKNIVLIGIQNATAYKASGFARNMDGGKILLKFRVPAIYLLGPYRINGKVLILPIQGEGQANLTMENIDVTLKLITKEIHRDGKTYMQVDRSKVTFDTIRLYMHFSNLFKGDKALGDNMNLFLNDNWNDILNELQPSITEAFTKIFIDVLNGVFEQIPYNEMFLD